MYNTVSSGITISRTDFCDEQQTLAKCPISPHELHTALIAGNEGLLARWLLDLQR